MIYWWTVTDRCWWHISPWFPMEQLESCCWCFAWIVFGYPKWSPKFQRLAWSLQLITLVNSSSSSSSSSRSTLSLHYPHTHTVWGLLPLYFSLASQPAAPVQRVGGALCFHSLTKKSQQCRMGRDYMGWRYRLCTYIYTCIFICIYIYVCIYNCMYVITVDFGIAAIMTIVTNRNNSCNLYQCGISSLKDAWTTEEVCRDPWTPW